MCNQANKKKKSYVFDMDLDGDDYFGVCPVCGKTDGCLNVNRSHWFVCHKHKIAWNVGDNLFSAWRREDEATWQENDKLLRTYQIIDCGDAVNPKKRNKAVTKIRSRLDKATTVKEFGDLIANVEEWQHLWAKIRLKVERKIGELSYQEELSRQEDLPF